MGRPAHVFISDSIPTSGEIFVCLQIFVPIRDVCAIVLINDEKCNMSENTVILMKVCAIFISGYQDTSHIFSTK